MDQFNYKIYPDNVQIRDSWQIKWRWQMNEILDHIMDQISADHPIRKIKRNTLLLEWSAHNLLHRFNYHPDQTGSVDLNVGESWIHRICYFILGWIGFIIPR